jgi:hypothetical protein
MKRDKVLQGWANRLKVIRAAVRLKYSLMADNELNEIIEAEAKKYFKSVQQGQLPEPLDLKKIVDGA